MISIFDPASGRGSPLSSGASLLGSPTVKRKAFFSFHFDDIMRVNNVRNAWRITHPDSATMRSFYDSSLWESRKLEGDESLKRLIREGVANTSAICVLVGTDTWNRRWVRYEIARAIIDQRGLLAVHINRLNHHQRCAPDQLGENPLAHLGIGALPGSMLTGNYHYLYEHTNNGWVRYGDYTDPVPLPPWLPAPQVGYVMPLSVGAPIYDYVLQDGHRNIGNWIDIAAQMAGR